LGQHARAACIWLRITSAWTGIYTKGACRLCRAVLLLAFGVELRLHEPFGFFPGCPGLAWTMLTYHCNCCYEGNEAALEGGGAKTVLQRVAACLGPVPHGTFAFQAQRPANMSTQAALVCHWLA
jgi:hypothetical protein